ncbi:MAG: FAD:protein FMN transferase [SAR324 cluster bacterium]|nr:FAD:protein FMN transferase [SAR324 cluster bacterium]
MRPDTIDRRTLIKKGGALLLVCSGLGLGPYLARNREIFKKSVVLMGTVAEIQVVHDDAKQAYEIIDRAFAEIKRIETVMSRFNKNSDIGRANRLAFEDAVPVSPETAEILQHAFRWSRVTGGAFDPAIGKLSEIWDIKNRSKPPQENQIVHLANRFFYQHVHLTGDSAAPRLKFTHPDVQLDLGGVAKGYAADQAIKVLTEAGLDQGLVNLGGDVAALGGKMQNPGWKIGIRDPGKPGTIAEVLELRNQAVATSGNYEQYFIAESSLYHHLIDPSLARPGRTSFHSLSIIGPNSCDTDALATGLFFFQQNKTNQILASNTEGFRAIRMG